MAGTLAHAGINCRCQDAVAHAPTPIPGQRGGPMHTQLVLVANHSQARMLTLDDADQLAAIENFVNQQQRESERPPPGQPATAGRDAAFAQCLVDALESHYAAGHFKGLFLIAPPPFLDTLCSQLGKKLQRQVVAKIDKDFTTNTESRILAVLPRAHRRQ
jgi:protein required for attachment to host cells